MSEMISERHNGNGQAEFNNVIVKLEEENQEYILENDISQVKNLSDSSVDFTLHQSESSNSYNTNSDDTESFNKKIMLHMELSQTQHEEAYNDSNSMNSKNTSQMFQTQEKRRRGRPRKFPRIENVRSEEQVEVVPNTQTEMFEEQLSESQPETITKNNPAVLSSIIKSHKSITPRNNKQVSNVSYMEENKEVASTSLDTECKSEVTNSIIESRKTNGSNITKKSQVQIVKCIKCQKEMQMNQWATHNLTKHNSMGWYEGQEPLDFENDLKLLRRTLTVALKRRKGQLSCEKCGVIKRSVNGFISHMQFCGKSDDERMALMATCSVCNAIMMPSSLEVHERQHREVKTYKNKNTAVETLEQAERVKRKAAEKAISKILQFTELVKDDISEQSKKIDMEPFVLATETAQNTNTINEDIVDEVNGATNTSSVIYPENMSFDTELQIMNIQKTANDGDLLRRVDNALPSADQDQYDIFSSYVATEIRCLRSDSLRRKLKRKIQCAIIEIQDEESRLLESTVSDSSFV